MYYEPVNIPPFNDFTAFTPAIPALYWNVDSEEQRYFLLCKKLCKLIAYCNALGIEVDKIQKILQDIIDGKLDELIIEAIEKWFEENEPQIIADINDLKLRVAALEDDVSDLEIAISNETIARRNADDTLTDYASLHNNAYDIVKPMRFFGDRDGMYVEMSSTLSEAEINDYRYAGKSLEEIFDPDAPWMIYTQSAGLSGTMPIIGGIQSVKVNEVSIDSSTNTMTFDSSGAYADERAVMTVTAIPGTVGHVVAQFCEMEFEEYEQGKFGIQPGILSWAMGVKGNRQIVGTNRNIVGATYNLVFGNQPKIDSSFMYHTPRMKTVVYDLTLIDLTILFSYGESDDPANFSQAYTLWRASKDVSNFSTTFKVVTEPMPTVTDKNAYEAFVTLMNQYAFNMGFVNTKFNSASGYPKEYGADTYNQDYNNFSCPVDMLKLLVAASGNSFLQSICGVTKKNIMLGRAWESSEIYAPYGINDPTVDLAYARVFGKGGTLNRNFTSNYSPNGVVNMIASCTLKNGHIGFISVMNTPYNSVTGLVNNNVTRYFYCIQEALNDVIDGTDPSAVTYLADLQNGMNYTAQPVSFAAFIAPDGFNPVTVFGQSTSRLLAWLKEANLYIGFNDGTNDDFSEIPTASVAKMMTAYIAVNECNLDDIIVMKESDYLGGSGGLANISTPAMADDMTITLRDALTGMLYVSDNTLATAIARHVGTKYANKMHMGSPYLFEK